LAVVTAPDGDVDYARYGTGQPGRRRADPRIAALAADIDSGRWDRRYGGLRAQPWYHRAVRLLVGGR
jgi:hypothetical protein